MGQIMTKGIGTLPVQDAATDATHVLIEEGGAAKRIPAAQLVPEVELPEDHLTYSPQELTDEQKAQARSNIGAVSAQDIPEAPEQVQADWSESDENSPAFVRNRTHYEQEDKTHVLFPAGQWESNTEETFTFSGTMFNWGDGYTWSSFGIDLNQTYSVEFDGTIYKVSAVAYSDNNDYRLYGFGNPELNPDGSDQVMSEYPFLIGYTNQGYYKIWASEDGEHSVSMWSSEKTVAPLDRKFLPANTVIADSTPTAHQQLVTDADGNATWTERLAYVKSSTASKGERLFYWIDIASAGAPEGDSNDRFELTADTEYYLYGKIYDMYPAPDVTLNGLFTAQTDANGTVYIGNPALLSSSNEDNGLVWCITGGFWYFKNSCSYEIEVAHVAYSEDIHPLDEKYIPETIARKADVGGVSSEFRIAIDHDADTDTYTSDKTYAQIMDAYEAGRHIVAIYDGEVYQLLRLPTDNQTTKSVSFGRVGDSSNLLNWAHVTVNEENAVSKESYNIYTGDK